MKRTLNCALLLALAVGCGRSEPPPPTEEAIKAEQQRGKEIRENLEGVKSAPKRQ